MRSTLLGLVTVSVAACSGSVVDNEFSEARARWAREAPVAYAFTWQQSCVCLADMVRPIRITVTTGQIDQATYVDDQQPVSATVRNSLDTIDGILRTIGYARDRGAAEITVDYDPSWGHPVSVFIDYERQVADEELALEISDFAPISR